MASLLFIRTLCFMIIWIETSGHGGPHTIEFCTRDEVVANTEGEILSQHYPNMLVSDRFCFLKLTGLDEHTVVMFHVNDLDLRRDEEDRCSDSLQIGGISANQLCNPRSNGEDIFSQAVDGAVELFFSSNQTGNTNRKWRGFKITYRALTYSLCSDMNVLTPEIEQSIYVTSHPTFGISDYSADEVCYLDVTGLGESASAWITTLDFHTGNDVLFIEGKDRRTMGGDLYEHRINIAGNQGKLQLTFLPSSPNKGFLITLKVAGCISEWGGEDAVFGESHPIEFSCPPGYQPKGDKVWNCVAPGLWSNSKNQSYSQAKPKCIAKQQHSRMSKRSRPNEQEPHITPGDNLQLNSTEDQARAINVQTVEQNTTKDEKNLTNDSNVVARNIRIGLSAGISVGGLIAIILLIVILRDQRRRTKLLDRGTLASLNQATRVSERPHQVEENIYTVNACGPEPPRRPESLHVGAAIAASSLTVLVPVPQLSANSLPSTEQEYCEAQPVVTRQASQVHGQYDIAEPVLMPRIHINDPQADRGYCLAQPVAELTPPELPEKSYANLKVSTRRPRPPIPSIRRSKMERTSSEETAEPDTDPR